LQQAIGENRMSPLRPDRLLSLDVMRGLIVAAMIVVNFSLGADGEEFRVYPLLLHSEWVGFTFADSVFPAFLFMVGVSISLTASSACGLDALTLRRIVMRSARLFGLGFLLSNLLYQWLHHWSFDGSYVVLGVLQRIGLCYGAAAILCRTVSPRVLVWLAGGMLVLYWPLTLLPIPGGQAVDLAIPGANFVSWFDRAVLGSHRWVPGPLGFDTAGLLSTLPALAQCLLGVVAGRSFVRLASKTGGMARFALFGAMLAVAGLLWGICFPIAESLWTSSYVLLTTGLSMTLLAGCQALLAANAIPASVVRFFAAFGVNAILAYALHFVCITVYALPIVSGIYRLLGALVSPSLASLCLATGFMLVVWLPTAFLYRNNCSIRI
jgi:predicted acyltransferase